MTSAFFIKVLRESVFQPFLRFYFDDSDIEAGVQKASFNPS